MDNIIYSYLINNYNNRNNEEFLNCLLILSINNLNITFNELQDYCNSINNYKNNNQNLQIKKIKKLQEEEKKHLNDLKGLNDKQFQTLNNQIQNLKNILTTNNSNNEIIYTHSITDNNNNDTINNRNKRISFDCSILIIIKNNLNHLTNNNNINQLILKSQSDINNKIKTNQQINQTIDNNYILFKKFWGNMIIRDQILFHLRIYNNHNHSFDIRRNNISTYKYRNYFNNVKLLDSDGYKNQRNSNCYPMPQIVENIEMRCSDIILGEHWIPDTCKSITFIDFDQQLTRNIIGNSLTSIDFGNEFNQSLSDTNGIPWLPRTLKSLTFGKLFQHSIHRDEIPPSLTSLLLDPKYQGVILYGSIPKSVTTLHCYFDSKDGTCKFDSTSVPGGTTSLEFDYFFNQTIEKGVISNNVTSLKFGSGNHKLEPDSLPISIKTLHLGRNKDYSAQLPPTITNLSIHECLEVFLLPKTIQTLKIMDFTTRSHPHLHSLYFFKNLTSLKLNVSQIDLTDVKFPPTISKLVLTVSDEFELNDSLLPNNLKKLKIYGFNQPLNVGDLPSSIGVLKLPSYKQPIQKDVLPSSLTLLRISDFFDSTIDRDALPPNLKSFYFTGYNCDELPDLIWPPSFEFVYIYNDSLNFINSIPTDFFIKHTKLLKRGKLNY
ncbi:hypothetical protein DDB_G0274637 [Dictyostelium discoideum AX4]|uniref:FNIP repeat-containing protein n=1 Tax=Dictyostelium discoideum TaxID=44689 RepID=Q554W2_DICDI|nr:hypothetical protein DDB_G0274637 [Dictyostelium discoideum AX4]EAL70211.1 hypothetical protein DDB_G0274637 [Dictyostelium discoideum AX4]|eukprot:XP_644211.1 hypothetical protein DDB_G0274637 [Dictyostelium discoideum AX4]